jgi:hypothetical protein
MESRPHTERMTKMNFAFAVGLVLGISSAQAATGKTFHAIDGVEKGCKVAKFAGGKWVQSDEKDLDGKDVTNVTPSKANAEFSNFKIDGNWFASKTDCLRDSETASDATAAPGSMPKYFVDLKGMIPMAIGTGNSATATTVTTTNPATSTVETFDKYSDSLGIDGRFGYFWKENKYFILDIATFSGSQSATYTGTFAGAPKQSDSILTVDVGIQMPFVKPLFGLKPYVAGLLGYAKLTGTNTGTQNNGTLTVGYSGSGFNVKIEGGLVKDFTPHISGVVSLSYNYLSLSPKYDVSNNTTLYPVGSATPSRGYSNIALALGARYSF